MDMTPTGPNEAAATKGRTGADRKWGGAWDGANMNATVEMWPFVMPRKRLSSMGIKSLLQHMYHP